MKAAITGFFFGLVILFGCAAQKWAEPPSWTVRADGHFRASQRKEDYTFAEWKANYLDKEGVAYGIALTAAGAKAVADKIAADEAEIVQLKNQISNGCR